MTGCVRFAYVLSSAWGPASRPYVSHARPYVLQARTPRRLPDRTFRMPGRTFCRPVPPRTPAWGPVSQARPYVVGLGPLVCPLPGLDLTIFKPASTHRCVHQYIDVVAYSLHFAASPEQACSDPRRHFCGCIRETSFYACTFGTDGRTGDGTPAEHKLA